MSLPYGGGIFYYLKAMGTECKVENAAVRFRNPAHPKSGLSATSLKISRI